MKMKIIPWLAIIFSSSFISAQTLSKDKQSLISIVDKYESDLIRLSDQIWAFAETALAETKSATILADYAKKKALKQSGALLVCPLLLLPAMDRAYQLSGY